MPCESQPPYFDQDQEFLKALDDERIKLTGPKADYYVHLRGQNVDPLYNEPTPWSYAGPYSISVSLQYVEADNKDEMVEETGYREEHDGTLQIARLEWESKVGLDHRPKSSDVVWVNNQWFDIVKAGRNGYVVNTPEWVGYQLQLKRRSKFEPNRKV